MEINTCSFSGHVDARVSHAQKSFDYRRGHRRSLCCDGTAATRQRSLCSRGKDAFGWTDLHVACVSEDSLGGFFLNGHRHSALNWSSRIRTNWARDPHVLGAYSYIPVNGLDLPKLLAASMEDTLFFAGEAAVSDAQCGTVSGAFESGLRAAREILDR